MGAHPSHFGATLSERCPEDNCSTPTRKAGQHLDNAFWEKFSQIQRDFERLPPHLAPPQCFDESLLEGPESDPEPDPDHDGPMVDTPSAWRSLCHRIARARGDDPDMLFGPTGYYMPDPPDPDPDADPGATCHSCGVTSFVTTHVTFPGGMVASYCEECAEASVLGCKGDDHDDRFYPIRGRRRLEMFADVPGLYFCAKCADSRTMPDPTDFDDPWLLALAAAPIEQQGCPSIEQQQSIRQQGCHPVPLPPAKKTKRKTRRSKKKKKTEVAPSAQSPSPQMPFHPSSPSSSPSPSVGNGNDTTPASSSSLSSSSFSGAANDDSTTPISPPAPLSPSLTLSPCASCAETPTRQSSVEAIGPVPLSPPTPPPAPAPSPSPTGPRTSCAECGGVEGLAADPFNPGTVRCEACWAATMRECVECRVVGLTGRVVEHPEWHFCEECWEEMTYLRRMPVVAKGVAPCPSAMSSPAATQAGAAKARAIEPPLIHTPQKHNRSSGASSPLAAPDAVALTGTGTAGGLDEQIEVLESSAQNTTPLSSHELPKHLCSIHPTGVALCHDEAPNLCSHTGHPRELFSAPGTLDDSQPAATREPATPLLTTPLPIAVNGQAAPLPPPSKRNAGLAADCESD